MQYKNDYKSPMGDIILRSDGEFLTGLWFDGGKSFYDTSSGEIQEKGLAVFEQTRNWLDIYFSGKIPDFTPPLSVKGSDFRQAVWEILKEIPYGQTMTYGEIAGRMANQMGLSKMSPQAVGGAVGHNPVSIIIPCHRVVGANGSLTGYAGGIDQKLALLTLEKVDMGHFFLPKKTASSAVSEKSG